MLGERHVDDLEGHFVGVKFLHVFHDADDLHGRLGGNAALGIGNKLHEAAKGIIGSEESLRGIAIDDGDTRGRFGVMRIKGSALEKAHVQDAEEIRVNGINNDANAIFAVRRAAGNIDGREQWRASKGKAAAEGDGLNAGKGTKLITQAAEIALLLVGLRVVVAAQGDAEGERAGSIESPRRLPKADETGEKKTGTEEKNEREGDFDNHKSAASFVLAAAGGNPSATLAQNLVEVNAGGEKCWDDAHN